MRVNTIPDPFGAIRMSDANTYRNEDTDTDEGRAFFGGTHLAPGGGNYAHIQLFNPGGSGVITLIDRIHIAASSNGALYLANYNTALTTLARQWPNADMGGTAGKSAVRTHALGSFLGTEITRIRIPSNSLVSIPLRAPIRLGEDKGFMGVFLTTGIELLITFEGREL